MLFYNASSPDELALTNAARHFGITFEERDEDGFMVIRNSLTNEVRKYELLNVIEFTSSRKRMSVIVRSPENKIIIMTKGADSIIIPRLASGQEDLI
jgi:magnesium-transporting ATPase (P-type)